MTIQIQIVLVALVTAAGWSDLRTRRIPNWITVSGAAIGFGLQVWNNGWNGALQSLGGALLGLGIFMVLYIAGGMGAGDVKLFGAVGAVVGPQMLILVFVLTGLLGGIAAIALSVWSGRLGETLRRTAALAAGKRQPADAQSLRLPYGAVIACGALISLICIR